MYNNGIYDMFYTFHAKKAKSTPGNSIHLSISSIYLQIAKLIQNLDGCVCHALLLESIDEFRCLRHQILRLFQQPAQFQRNPSLLLGLERVVLGVQTDDVDGDKVFGGLPRLQVFNDGIKDAFLEGNDDVVLLDVRGGRVLPPLRGQLDGRATTAQPQNAVVREEGLILRRSRHAVVHVFVGGAKFEYSRFHGRFAGQTDVGTGAVRFDGEAGIAQDEMGLHRTVDVAGTNDAEAQLAGWSDGAGRWLTGRRRRPGEGIHHLVGHAVIRSSSDITEIRS